MMSSSDDAGDAGCLGSAPMVLLLRSVLGPAPKPAPGAPSSMQPARCSALPSLLPLSRLLRRRQRNEGIFRKGDDWPLSVDRLRRKKLGLRRSREPPRCSPASRSSKVLEAFAPIPMSRYSARRTPTSRLALRAALCCVLCALLFRCGVRMRRSSDRPTLNLCLVLVSSARETV